MYNQQMKRSPVKVNHLTIYFCITLTTGERELEQPLQEMNRGRDDVVMNIDDQQRGNY